MNTHQTQSSVGSTGGSGADLVRCEAVVTTRTPFAVARTQHTERCRNATTVIVSDGEQAMGLCDECAAVFRARNGDTGFAYSPHIPSSAEHPRSGAPGL